MLRGNQFDRVGNSPVPEVSAGASRYRQMMGFNSPEMDYGRSVVPASASRGIGQAYMNMPGALHGSQFEMSKARNDARLENRKFGVT